MGRNPPGRRFGWRRRGQTFALGCRRLDKPPMNRRDRMMSAASALGVGDSHDFLVPCPMIAMPVAMPPALPTAMTVPETMMTMAAPPVPAMAAIVPLAVAGAGVVRPAFPDATRVDEFAVRIVIGVILGGIILVVHGFFTALALAVALVQPVTQLADIRARGGFL